MSFYPKSTIGRSGIWVVVISTILLGFKFASLMPLPTPIIFGLIFAGSFLNIWALIKDDRSWLQLLIVLPVFLFAFIWTLAEVIWPH